jgi:hypothetical protein
MVQSIQETYKTHEGSGKVSNDLLQLFPQMRRNTMEWRSVDC